MVSIQFITLILVAVINAAVVWVIASQGWKNHVNRYFVMAVFFVIFWSLGTALLLGGSTSAIVWLGALLYSIAPMLTIMFLSLFAAIFPEGDRSPFTKANILLIFVTLVYSAVIIYRPDIIISSFTIIPGHLNSIQVDATGYVVYNLYFTFVFGVAFSELFMRIRQHQGYQRKQLQYIFAGTFAAAILSLITNLFLPTIGQSQYVWIGPTSTLFYVFTISVSIVKYQLFDIKLAAVRSLVYVGVLLTLSGIYYLFAYVTSVVLLGGEITNSISLSPVNIFLALFLAFLFQPIKKFFDRITNNVFYRDSYKSEEFFADLGQLLASTTDLRGLLERASAKIAATLKAEQAFFFLHYTNASHHHISAGTPKHSRIPMYDARMLDAYVANSKDELILVETLAEDSELRRMLVSHKITLVMALRYADGVIGYVCLGDQRGRGYTKRDLQVLSTIADELVIAIQNALSLHEIKEINATLQQRIDNATKELRSSNAQLRHLDEVKDEFMSMASHQLRTPLTSVKGYLSMVIEGDTGDISPQQRRVLEEAFNSSERMVRLIADFLNVSRLQTGKFVIEKAPSDIVKVVKEEVSSLKVIAKTHDMKLVFQIPKESLPKVEIDEAKIRQVIMNFIDNAIYYSKPNTSVKVVLEQVDNDIAFRVIDTGIGVPEDEQPKLFNKFFRAKNARKQRPDGTGVGLYLAKKVITAHRGKMIFASEEGKGSTFGFRIPMDQQ